MIETDFAVVLVGITSYTHAAWLGCGGEAATAEEATEVVPKAAVVKAAAVQRR